MQIEVASKNAQLDEQFNDWRKRLGDEGSKFIYDGIIKEDIFFEQSERILFIGKDPHDSKYFGWDFRIEWPKDRKWRHARQVKRWTYGILNGFPPFEEARWPKENYLCRVAFMNVKKTGGRSSSEYDDVLRHATEFSDLIKEQIKVIQPTLIIGGLSFWLPVWEAIFGKAIIENKVTIEDIDVFTWNDIPIIDYYHPSNRLPHSMQYALLSRVFGSQKFKEIRQHL